MPKRHKTTEIDAKGIVDLLLRNGLEGDYIVRGDSKQASFVIEAKNDLKRIVNYDEFFERLLALHRLEIKPVKPPPRFIESVLWLVLPRRVRDAIMGDAAEAYAETLVRYPNARWMAMADYCKEAIFAIIGSSRMSVAQWINFLFKRTS